MATDTIKEFLAKLGFKVDEAGLKKFNAGLATATKSVFALGSALEGLAISVAYGVERISNDLEQLYFASQRTRSSAENIKALDTAAQNFGATADEAKSSLEAFAHFLRANPTGEAVVRMFGIKTRDKTGRLRDTSEMLVDLGEQFQKMPVWMALQRGQMLGLSENTILALSNPEYRAEYESLRKTLKDSGFAESAKDAHLFMEQLRSLLIVVEAFGARVATAIGKQLGVTMRDIIDWMNNPANVERTKNLLMGVVSAAEEVGKAVRSVIDFFIDADKATSGFSTQVLLLGVYLKYLGGAEIIGRIYAMGTALAIAMAPLTVLVGAGISLGWLINKLAPGGPLAKIGEAFGGAMSGGEGGGAFNLFQSASDAGLDPVHAIALAGVAKTESGGNAYSERRNNKGELFARGLFQLDPDQSSHYEKWAEEYTGKPATWSAQQQIQWRVWDIKHGSESSHARRFFSATNVGDAARYFETDIQRPKDKFNQGEGSSADRASKAAISIQQDIVINVNGSGLSKEQLQSAVKNGVADANSSVVRNAANGVR